MRFPSPGGGSASGLQAVWWPGPSGVVAWQLLRERIPSLQIGERLFDIPVSGFKLGQSASDSLTGLAHGVTCWGEG